MATRKPKTPTKARTTTTARRTIGARRSATTRRTNNRVTNGTTTNTERLNTVTPFLAVKDAGRAIDWYKKALGAKETSRMPGPEGKIMHAELTVGDSRIFINDIFPQSPAKDPLEVGAPVNGLHVYHKDIDKLFNKAVKEGANVLMPLENQFWGDRYGQLVDPFGVMWTFGYPAKMTEAEKAEKQREAMEQMKASMR